MSTKRNGPAKNTGRDDVVVDDDIVSEPKSGGLDRPGADQDDNDVVSQQPSSGTDHTGD